VTVTSEISIQLREDGNELYSQANAKNITSAIKKEKLQEAMECFEKALKTSRSDLNAAASACKNYAKTSLCLLAMLEDEHSSDKKECYAKAISYFSQALLYGKKCKDIKWIGEIVELYGNTVEEAIQKYQELKEVERIIVYESFAHVMVDDIYQVDLHTVIARLLLQKAL